MPRGKSHSANFSSSAPAALCVFEYIICISRGCVPLFEQKRNILASIYSAASRKGDGLLPSLLFALNIPFEQKDALRAVGITLHSSG
jgi:predicted membrane metal-binding protein